MSFDEIIERRGSHCIKWDGMEQMFGVPADTGIAMWVADMDFRPPACITQSVQAMVDHGIFGYFGNDKPYRDAICWWMQTRHGWAVDPANIFTTHGLVNGTGLCVEAFTHPGDAVVVFTPVYHAFARVITAAGRQVRELPLVNNCGRLEMDFGSYDALMTGTERMAILCSPHNPGGRVWTAEELRHVADFCQRHDMVLVSDEIHHDLVFPGQKHLPMPVAAPDCLDRLVMMTATTKTFNIAGCHTGNVIISDPDLKQRFAATMNGLGISPNSFGMHMARAAYSPEGAAWVDGLMAYLAGNQRLFNDGMAAIPGVKAMELEATYLSWVDFSGTGMDPAEFTRRVEKEAQIAVNYGSTFGTGGASFLRINIATPRSVVKEAVSRLQRAFADLQ